MCQLEICHDQLRSKLHAEYVLIPDIVMLKLTDIENDIDMGTHQSTCWLHEENLAKKHFYYCSAAREFAWESLRPLPMASLTDKLCRYA